MRNIILVIGSSLLLCFSCERDLIEDNKRIIIDASVVDVLGNARSDITVEYLLGYANDLLNDEGGVEFFQTLVLTTSRTDNQGNVDILSVVPNTSGGEAYVTINNKGPNFGDLPERPDLGTVIYQIESDELELRLPETILREKADLNVIFTNTSGPSNQLRYTINMPSATRFIIFPNDEIIEQINFEEFISSEQIAVERNFETLLGVEATLTYQIIQEGEIIEEDSIIIPITETNQVYELEY